MKKHISLILTLALVAACFSGCSGNQSQNLLVSDPASESETIATPVPDSSTELSSSETLNGDVPLQESDNFDEVFRSYISNQMDGNYMVSPLSFRYALGLLLSGSNGNNRDELLKALGVETEKEWNRYVEQFSNCVEIFDQSLADSLENFEYMKDAGYFDKNEDVPTRALKVANSVWKRNDITAPFEKDYIDTISKIYSAECFDFSPDEVIKKVNEWSDKKTEGMIPTLLPENYDTSNLALILMNALYFKDAWCEPFHKSSETDFTVKDGSVVKKEFITRTGSANYYKDDQTQLVSVSMEGGINMVFVLGDTADLQKKLNNAKYCEVEITVPKIDLETSLSNGELVNFLKACGVQEAFSTEADFSRMIDHEVFVSDIIQKTHLKLDEKGIEAAAITAVMMKDSCISIDEPEIFIANKPFSFYIYSQTDNSFYTLFAGEIVE